MDGGSRRDPAAQAGLAGATAGMLSAGVAAQGGQPALDENQLSEAWVDLGAQFGAGASQDRFTASLRTLTQPDLLQGAVALAARQLAAPAWPEKVWQRDRERTLAALREAETRPGTLAGRAFAQAVLRRPSLRLRTHGRHPDRHRRGRHAALLPPPCQRLQGAGEPGGCGGPGSAPIASWASSWRP